MTDDTDTTADCTDQQARADGGRDQIEVPDEIDLPRLLDFYDLQTEEHTQIHEFYDNLKDGEFTTTRCSECGEVHFPPRIICPECHSDDLEYVPLPEDGELYAFTEVRAGAPLGMEDDVPFVSAIVELDNGIRLSTRVDDATEDDLSIGDPVSFKAVDIDGPADHERAYFRFEPA